MIEVGLLYRLLLQIFGCPIFWKRIQIRVPFIAHLKLYIIL